ncbi:DUF6510 family protein [Kribbella sp. NPDC051137]|uniref:DUF6510 family protein n=1 Tax=Kribbella sp. NPDC051137 TaxID=3155045 RepID=UPI003421D16B
MTPLDGNAIAAVLHELFGREVTASGYACQTCGSTGYVAELAVYPNGPGIVGRCRSCDTILLMITERKGRYCVDSGGLS